MTTAVAFAAVGSAMAGALAFGVACRAARSMARWTFALGMAVLAAESACNAMVLYVGPSAVTDLLRWQHWRLLCTSLLPGCWLLFSLCYARGNARDFLNRWRITLAVALVLPPSLVLFSGSPQLESLRRSAESEEWLLLFDWRGVLLYLCVLGSAVLIIMNLERTFRASAGTRRWRIKFMLFGVALLFGVRLYTSSQVLLFHGIVPAHAVIDSCGLVLGIVLVSRSIFRTGNFELDVYPSHSVLQGSATVLLAGTYLLIVGAFAKVVEHVGGDSEFALKAFLVLVSLVLLAVLLQSDRVNLYLGRLVSRHFQRPLYDYRTLWRTFTEGTASRVEQPDLARSLVKLATDTFQALSVTLWLLDEKKEALFVAASTSLPSASSREGDPRTHRTDIAAIVTHFRSHTEVVDIDRAKGEWASQLREWHPTEFPTGGNRVCIPLTARSELIGLMTLGDRVGGMEFHSQDFDTLKCIGDHAAASLLNVQLSQRLLQAKELEAFQTMAAFFVHDLKNAASTLNLMLQNLPVHFDDPAFREDALRGTAKTVNHINHLIGRLGQLRHDLKMQFAKADLNTVVGQALTDLGNGVKPGFTTELVELPPILLDREQVLKVVTNLLLNAAEATGGPSPVRVATERAGEWVVLTVEDKGCGMSPDFVRRSLFRPFQTTKKRGLGIGMFQSKMIVEAHHGRIAVASEPGKGTTFRVFLPVQRPSA